MEEYAQLINVFLLLFFGGVLYIDEAKTNLLGSSVAKSSRMWCLNVGDTNFQI